MRCILGVFLFLCASLVAYSQSKTYQVGFLLDRNSTEIEKLILDLSNEISAVVGEDAVIEFPKSGKLVNNFDANQALTNYNALVNSEIDIIIALGLVNNSVISKMQSYLKPTILFGAMSKELLSQREPKAKTRNYTSIITTQSYTEDLKLLKKLANPKIVGVAIEKTLANNLSIDKTFKSIAEELGSDLKVIEFTQIDDITNNLENIDALYLAGGYYLNEDEIRQLANLLIEKKLPSFTTNPLNDVKNGILASNYGQSELNQFFRRIALTVESAVNGDDISSLSTKLEAQPVLTVNYNTAEKIGLPLRYSLIASTNFIGKPEEISADKIYSLVSVMQEAIIENLELETFRQDIALSEKEVQISKSDYLPDVLANAAGNYTDPEIAELGFGQNPEVQTIGNVSLSQLVFSNSANANITIQKALRAAQQENYNSEALNTVFNSAQAYFNALIFKANLKIQNQNLNLTKYNLKIAQQNFEAGQSGKSDVLRFRSERAQNTQVMIEAINQLERSYYDLNLILNNPIDLNIDVEEAILLEGVFSNYNYKQIGAFLDDPTLRIPFVKFLVQEAMNNAPELKALDYNIEVTERTERLFGAGRFLPTVALQGQYNYEFSRSGAGSEFPNQLVRPKGFYNAGVNLSLPIFNQNRQNLNQQIAQIQKAQLNVSKDNFELSIEKNINNAVLQIINQISNIELSKVYEETAKEALDLTQTSYANGAVNIVQLLDAQNNYLQAQLASATATYNYLLSSLQLERFLGTFFLLQTDEEQRAFTQRFLEFTQLNND